MKAAVLRREGVVRSQSDPPRLSQNGVPLTQMANLSSFAEQMLVHQNSVVKARDDVPFEVLALIGCCVTTGVGAALNTARVEPGSTMAVIGCGIVGLSCSQGAVLAGALRIIVIDTVETKLGMARDFGATDVIDASGETSSNRSSACPAAESKTPSRRWAPKRLPSRSSRCLKTAERRPSSAWSPRGRRSSSTAAHFSESAGFRGAAWARTVFESTCPGTSNTILQGRLKLEQINEAFEDMKQGHVARSVITFD